MGLRMPRVFLLLLASLLLIITSYVLTPSARPASLGALPSQTRSLLVTAEQDYLHNVGSLWAGNVLDGRFVVEGGGNGIEFTVKAPSGIPVMRCEQCADSLDFRVKVLEDGFYTVVFGNRFVDRVDRRVTLVYAVY